MAEARRPLTAPEKYFAYLDQAWPMNIMLVADLDRAFPIEQVAETWTRFCTRRIAARTVVTENLELFDAGTSDVHFAGVDLDPSRWDDELAREASVPYGFDHPLRCRYLRSPDGESARLFIIGHHAIVDGRSGALELQWLLRAIDGQEVPAQALLSVPPLSPMTYEWQRDRRALIALLQEIREENARHGPPGPDPWPPADVPRAPRFMPMSFDADESARILAAARAHDARPFSTMAAAWLIAVARNVCEEPGATLQLNTPMDVAPPHLDADRPPSIAVAVLTGRYDVGSVDPWVLAASIATNVRASRDRGEGELFFHLARVGAIADIAQGVRTVSGSIGSTAPAVSVTNLGVVDPGTDPDWVRWVCGYQAPTPNQVAFVSGLGYRGQLVNMVATDDNRVTADRALALTQGFREVIAEMTG